MTTLTGVINSTTKDADAIYQQLNMLRDLAKKSPQKAQDDAWKWIESLGKHDDQYTLAELFSHGEAENPCTKTLGMPVGPMRNIAGGSLITAFLKFDSPWTGKTFYADGCGGYNRIKSYSKIPVSFLAPFHTLRRDGDEYIGFNFDTSIQQGAVEPKVQVIAIEYAAPQYKNPSKLIPLTLVRDELVKVLPNTYLGRATFPDQSGNYILVGYFALKSPINMES